MNIIIGGFSKGVDNFKTSSQFLCSFYSKADYICAENIHCNPLQENYRVELLHSEIPVVTTGNEFTEYNFLLFWLHFFPCFKNFEIVALIPVMFTGKC